MKNHFAGSWAFTATKVFVVLLTVLTIVSIASAKWGQEFISSVGMTNLKGRVGDHFEGCVSYQIGWFTNTHRSGPITVTDSDVRNPQYVLFAHSLPNGLIWNQSTGCLSGTPTESGQWPLKPGVRDANRKMYNGHGYWFTEFTTDTQTGLVYSTPQPRMQIILTIER